MTLKELVEDTRTDRQLFEDWADLLESIMALEERLDNVEAEIKARGYSV